MQFTELPISGAFRIDLDLMKDERGFFARTFSAEEYEARGLVTNFVQRSISFNQCKGTLRGMHYQAQPHLETKIVRCIVGAAYDVIVDLRRNTQSYGRWHSELITANNRSMIYIPSGCAHGFQTLVDSTEIYYEIAPAYNSAASRGIAYDDPMLAISWPLPDPIVSAADGARPSFSAAETFV